MLPLRGEVAMKWQWSGRRGADRWLPLLWLCEVAVKWQWNGRRGVDRWLPLLWLWGGKGWLLWRL